MKIKPEESFRFKLTGLIGKLKADEADSNQSRDPHSESQQSFRQPVFFGSAIPVGSRESDALRGGALHEAAQNIWIPNACHDDGCSPQNDSS